MSSSAETTWRGFLQEAALITAAVLAYFGIRNITAGSPGVAFANADLIVAFERSLHIDFERTIQDTIIGNHVLTMLVNWVYIWGHWPVILSVAAALYLYRRDRYYLLRNALFVSGAIGFLFFAFFPVAPPRLLDLGLVDTITDESHAYRALQPPGLTNQYASFPSLHVGWNVLVGVVLLMTAAHLAVRAFAVVMPLAMAFAVVATANHFVVDVVAGVAVVLVGLAVALAIESRQAAATLGAGGPIRIEPLSLRAPPVPRRASSGQPPPGSARGRAPRHHARRG
jgi:hypothetical protein